MSFLSKRIKRLGPVVKYYQKKYPSHSTCFHCGLPWAVADDHYVPVRECTEEHSGSGFFTCCEYCWQRMTDFEKIDSVIALFNEWEECGGSPYTMEEMLDALERDLKGSSKQ